MTSDTLVDTPLKDGPAKDGKDGAANGRGARARQLDSVRRALELLKPRFALALPSHLSADRLLRVVMTVLQNNPELLDCERASLYRAVMTCAQLGLEPDGVLGQAYLVPHRGRVQLVPGYRGFITLARNSGELASINAQVVHEKDRFEYAYGLAERLEHVPAVGERGEIIHFYAYARFHGGGHHFEVMSRAEVDAVRDKSESYRAFKEGKTEESPWVSHYPEMGKKTVIRRIARYLPMSVQKAAALAEIYESGRYATFDDYGDVIDFTDAAGAPEPVAPTAGEVPEAASAPGPEAAAAAEALQPEAPRSRLDLFADAETGIDPFEQLPVPIHVLRILEAVSERRMPVEVLAEIVGMPLDEVPPEDAVAIVQAIEAWRPAGEEAS